MKIGLSIIAMKASEIAAGAVLAEELGYDSLWYGEHILLPYRTKYPVEPAPYGPQELFDVFALLANLAGRTSRIRLATGIVMLPLRAPIMAARQILAVDVLSGGRFDMAVGLGWHPDEYEAAGTDMATRGVRTDEMLDLINRLFQPGDIEYEGRFYRVPRTKFEPKPIQTPRPPFLIGGATEHALRRAARWDGWYGVVRSLDHYRAQRDKLMAFRREYGREREPFQMVLVFHEGLDCKGAPTSKELEGYLAEGVDRIVVTPWGYDYKNALPRIAQYAREVGIAS
jgi:probable F420-dependent oxidoreductase